MKILIVSSYPPRHCGIGAYARDQVERLRAEGHDVTVLSPRDGEGDVRVSFWSGRPFFRAARLGDRFERIVVHFQPALYYRPRSPVSKVLASAGLLWLVKRRRTAEILVHEADPPIGWRPDYVLLRLAFRSASKVLFHTEAERAAFVRDYGIPVQAELVPHRIAAQFGVVTKAEARERLRTGPWLDPVFVCAGFIQRSKGFDLAVDAFRGWGGGSLFVVGSPRDSTPDNLAYLQELRGLSERTVGATLIECFLSDEEFDLWVAAADWILLPYRRAFSSGVLARAQTLGTPAIVTDVGGLREQSGPGDVVVSSEQELTEAVRDRIRPYASDQANR